MTINPTLILIKSIIVTHINKTLDNPLPSVDALIDEAIDLVVPKNMKLMGEVSETDVLESLTMTLSWLRDTTKEDGVTVKDIAATIKIHTNFDTDYSKSMMDLIGDESELTDEDAKKKKITLISSEINFAIKKKRSERKLRNAQKELALSTNSDQIDSYLKELAKDIESDTHNKDGNFPGYVGGLETADPSSVEEVASNTKVLNSDEGTLVIPLKGIKDALGGVSVRRGDLYCVKARSGRYKSGHLLDLTTWIPRYNKPNMTDKKKIPLVLRVSFENTPEQDFNTLYTKLKEGKEQKKVDISKINSKEAVKEFIEHVEVNGYKVAIVCFDPNKFDVWKLIDVMTYYELKGYEIHAVICDYLEIVTRGNKLLRQDSAIASAFEVVRNHCMPKRIAFFTAHQLNTASGDLLAEVGSSAFAKRVAMSGGLYDHNCRSLIQKLDIELILHIHNMDGVYYLAFAFGKLRERVVEEKLKYFYYLFNKFGGIIPDIDCEESKAVYSLSPVSADTSNGGSSVAW